MADEKETPTTETVELPAEPKGQVVATSDTAVEDEYSRERAMRTIMEQRKSEADLKKAVKELSKYKEELDKIKQNELGELERTKLEAEELKKALQKERLENIRTKVASKFNLPEVLASRLQGETIEEMEADAELLVKTLPKPKKENPQLSANDIGDGKKGESDAQKRARIYNKGTNLFDIDNLKQNGGGVFFNTDK